ncbi:hypothetical protein EV1_031264 [Malus domestica]|uniref:Small ubiquitin-related modifier 2-like n=2 Tax=Maleae TaxID=721813 RepID=A0A5N5H845_9ROSA|nr:small ubiquitin-related modifier 2-like [Pyrus ussuriensis x Pyrus communis]TQE03550.1 hypothetical protein C1H46_010865 [Malus baccata]
MSKASDQENRINIKCQYNEDGQRTFFRMRRNAKLQKLIDVFCTKRDIDPKAVDFIFDGQRVNKKKTLEQHGIEDNDEIEVFLRVGGGAAMLES